MQLVTSSSAQSPPTPAPPAPPLPRRPCLAPDRALLRRGADAVQFGVEATRALVLDGLNPPLTRMVTALDGTRRTEDVLADAVAAGVASTTARAVMARLQDAGMLVDGPGVRGTETRVPGVVIHGGGRVAVALACLLAASRRCRVAVRARGTVSVDDVGTGLAAADVGRPRALAVAEALARVQGGEGLPIREPDLVVLADASLPDPQTARSVREVAHLAVGVIDGRGVVGPLVLPGRTACLRCVEITRSDEDPAWPAVVAQLCVRRGPVDPASAAATAALAAAQVLAATAGSGPAPPALGATLELDTRGGVLARRPHEPHPACDCRRAERSALRAA